jgi:spore germination cell wall hydrolase CwlJ-like protein
VRIQLSLTLALFLLGGATPLHASVDMTPRCPSSAPPGKAEIAGTELPPTELGEAVPNYNAEDRDYMVRTIAFEAPEESEEGKAAVAHVILNRTRNGIWGDNIKDVVTHPWQFEPWMTKREQIQNLSPDDPRYRSAAEIADAVLNGEMPDPTAGATHFLNPTVVRERRGGSLPSWARAQGQPIGRHTFYQPNERSFARELTAVGVSPSCSTLEAGQTPDVG